jgi:hypothetical protein
MHKIGLLTFAALAATLVGRLVIATTHADADTHSVRIDPYLMMTKATDLVAQHTVDYSVGP